MPTDKIIEKPILLDTHIWIWLTNGDQKVNSPKLLHYINKAVEKSRIFVSVISVWEIAMLEVKKRIALPYSCLEWVQRALRAPGTSLVTLTPEITIESTRLPGTFHGDPVDRILIATAKDMGASLATADRGILIYSREHNIEVVTL
jgi:PIN domain nuclease of toxin-antitoxin system